MDGGENKEWEKRGGGIFRRPKPVSCLDIFPSNTLNLQVRLFVV